MCIARIANTTFSYNPLELMLVSVSYERTNERVLLALVGLLRVVAAFLRGDLKCASNLYGALFRGGAVVECYTLKSCIVGPAIIRYGRLCK